MIYASATKCVHQKYTAFGKLFCKTSGHKRAYRATDKADYKTATESHPWLADCAGQDPRNMTSMNAQSRPPLTRTISVKCRTASGRSHALLLLTLSRDGCTLEPLGRAPAGAQDAQVQLPGLSFLAGRITSASASQIRFEFDNQLYEPVFEDLKARLRGN